MVEKRFRLLFLRAALCAASLIALQQGSAAPEPHTSPAATGTAAPAANRTAASAAPVAADSRAAEILSKTSASLRAMPSYGVSFSIASGDYTSNDRYSVEKESYYMTLGDIEVFCDGHTRYEIDNRHREVTISDVDTKSRNILNNPVHAFEFLDSEYSSSLEWERDGRAAVRLTPVATAAPKSITKSAPKSSAASSGAVTLTVDTSTMRPLSLNYDYDGQAVVITVTQIAPLTTPLKSFDRAYYAGYEFIDFR